MAGTADRTDPALWESVKREVTRGAKGGRAGQWSVRKAQLAVAEYKKKGGGYRGPKPADNHLRQWTEEDWGTKSGGQSGETGERYLPRRARQHLSDREYAETTAKKRHDTRLGKQFSRQPEKIARKTAADWSPALAGLPRAALLERAARAGISGRSRMRKGELVAALLK
jgi:hypothetical protein